MSRRNKKGASRSVVPQGFDLGANEIALALPNALVTGDPGQSLKGPVTRIIRVLAACGYAPLDFGTSEDESHTVLVLYKVELSQRGESAADAALRHANFFIKNGGND